MTVTALRPRAYQGSPEWLEERLGGYGSSDVPVLVAGDEEAWHELHARKLRILPAGDEGTESMKWGIVLEDTIAAAYAEHPEGAPVVRVNRIVRHPELDHVRASLDRRHKRGRVVVELKKWGFVTDEFGPSGTDRVPEKWIDQVQQQLAVTGYDRADIAVLFAGGTGPDPFRVYHIGRDQSRMDALLNLENAAWAYVARGEMPPWPGPAPTRLRIRDGELEADPELEQLLEQGHVARQAKQAAEKLDKELTAAILERIGEYAVVRGSALDVTAKPNRDSERTDHQLVAAAYRKALEELAAMSPVARAAWTPPDLDAIASLFTTVKPGARPLRYVPHKED